MLRSASIALALLGSSLGPTLASDEPARLGLTPVGESGPYFRLSLDDGEAADLQVELANFGDADVLARTYAADAFSIVNGGFGAELFGEPAAGTTRWLDYETREIRLEPTDAAVLNLRVEVPPNTPPGEYVAALVAENVEPYRDGASSVTLEQVNRVAVAVAINVPGPRKPDLVIGAVSHAVSAGTSFVSFQIHNPGNVHLKPAGDFTLRDAGGNHLATAPAAMDSVYAGSATRFEAPLAAALPPGTYCAELSLRDEASRVTAQTECLPFAVGAATSTGEDEGGHDASGIPVGLPALGGITHIPGAPVFAIGVLALVLWWLVARTRQTASDQR